MFVLVLLLGMVVRSWPGRGALPALIGTGLIGLAIMNGTAVMTGLACLAVCAGLSPTSAVEYVRASYHPHAVETPWQAWYVEWFGRQGLRAGR